MTPLISGRVSGTLAHAPFERYADPDAAAAQRKGDRAIVEQAETAGGPLFCKDGHFSSTVLRSDASKRCVRSRAHSVPMVSPAIMTVDDVFSSA